MTEGVNQDVAKPEDKILSKEGVNDKEFNFRRLEADREREREARIRAEMQTEMMQRELQQIREMMKPKDIDPLDQINDMNDLEADKLKAVFAHRDAKFEKKTREIIEQTLQQKDVNEKKTNPEGALRRQYQDYDRFMNPDTIASIQERDPDAIDAIAAIEDPYVRREKAYQFIKKRIGQVPKQEDKPIESVKQKVEENMQNPYLIPSSAATPPYGGIEFDVSSSSSRKNAYEKLKAAQRRPIGNGVTAR